MKTVLITGVSGGIGFELMKKFLNEDYFVLGTFNENEVDFQHENLLTLRLDLASPDSICNCVKLVSSQRKSIDILINNAAIIESEPDGIVDIDIFRKTLEIDLVGLVDFTNQIVPLMEKGGHIVNISSRQGSLSYITRKRNPSYNITKAALNMFTRTLSIQLDDSMIVSSVHPGAVKTKLAAIDADMEPEESAEHIYDLAISKPETGQFWFKGEKFPW